MNTNRRMSRTEEAGARYWAQAGDMDINATIKAHGGASHAASAAADYLTQDGQHDYNTIYTAVLAFLVYETKVTP